MHGLKTFCVAAIGVSACLTAESCAPHRAVVGACSAFDKRGDAAMVTLETTQLTVQFSGARGGSFSLRSSITGSPVTTTCSAFFSGDSRFVAVGINTVYPQESMRVLAADVAAKRWAGDFPIPIGGILGSPVSLLGFAPDTLSLVVLGTAPIANINTSPKGFSTALIDVPGERTGPPVYHALPDDAGVIKLGWGEAADVRNNRLWFDHRPDPCPLRSVPLLGVGPNGPTVGSRIDRSICYQTGSSAFPDGNTLIVDESDFPAHYYAWRVNLQEQTEERLELPNDPGNGNRLSVVGNLMSPDAEIVGVLCQRYEVAIFSWGQGPEIDVVEVKPFKFLGERRFNNSADPGSFSIYHGSQTVTILGFWDGDWHRREVKVK